MLLTNHDYFRLAFKCLEKATNLVIKTEPDLVVGSPMCKDFSWWQRLNKAVSQELEEFDAAKKNVV